MFSLEKKRLRDFDGCFPAFRDYCVTIRGALRFFGVISVGPMGRVKVREGQIRSDVFRSFPANLGKA